MSIPVMDSVIRMQQGSFDEVAEDFTTCIHCGLCRFVCEDKVKPHNMGLWVRRSLGRSQKMTAVSSEDSESIEKEWQHLMIEDKQERLQRAKHFVTKAGLVILSVTIVVWVLGYFPNQGADLGASWLGTIGKWIEPVFQPLGLDWRYGVAIVSAFLAREVFVGTLGTIMGIEGAEDNILPLVEQIQASALPLGSGLALLVFFAIALQCVSTVAILAREANSWRLAGRMVVAYLCIAWLAAWATFQITAML